MRRSYSALATASALALVLSWTSWASASFVEQFETLVSGQDAPPGTALPLPTGSWFAINNSVPIGPTGVSRLPTAVGGTTPWPVNPGDGDFYASMNFNNGADPPPTQIDTYLMSPQLTFNNGDQISFITRTISNTFPDRLILKLSTSGASTNAADFTTTLLSVNGALGANYPTTWTLFSATISGLGGPTSGRFAFNYNVPDGGPSGANSNIIGIDRAAFTQVPEPASCMFAAGACGLLALRRRRAA